MITHNIDIELPPLPEPTWVDGELYWYDRHMEAYARAAIEADRKRRGEPVMYQVRTRPNWNDYWNRWEECTREQAEGYRRNPIVHDWHYEVRELFTAPQPAEPVKCIGCEGKPAPENNPCAVCGKEAEPVTPRIQFEDARVQKVYSIICGDNHPPYGEHWDGYVSRLIVDALFPAEPVKAFIDNQEPLGEEFQRVLDEHSWDLYVKTTEQVKVPSKSVAKRLTVQMEGRAEPVKGPNDEVDLEEVRRYLDDWGCLDHPGVRALLSRYGSATYESTKQQRKT